MESQNNGPPLGNTQKNLYAYVSPVKPPVNPGNVKNDINAYIESVLKVFDEEISNAAKLDKEKSEKENKPISISGSRTKLIESREKLKELQKQAEANIPIQEFVKNVREIYKVLRGEFVHLQGQRNSWFFYSRTKNYTNYVSIYNRVLGGIYSSEMPYPIVLAEYTRQVIKELKPQNGGNRKSKRSKRSQSKTKRAYRKTRYMRRK